MGRNYTINKMNFSEYGTLKLSILALLLLFFAMCLSGCVTKDESEKYEAKIISELQVKESVSAKDIFDFGWSRAFVIKEGYIDGESFSRKYDLDISIEEVDECINDQLRRIVFVDSNGEFVFLFSFWDAKELSIAEDGIIIYPETLIQKSDKYNYGFCVKFLVEPEDYLIPKE